MKFAIIALSSATLLAGAAVAQDIPESAPSDQATEQAPAQSQEAPAQDQEAAPQSAPADDSSAAGDEGGDEAPAQEPAAPEA